MTEIDIIQLLKANQKAPKWVTDARAYHKTLKALVLGDDYKDEILKIEHIEVEKKAIARRKYSRPIKDLNARLLRNVDNVYAAKGGTKIYDISNETKKEEFLKLITHIRGGRSVENWLQTFWAKDLYVVDPNGLMLLERKDNISYPTYKSIDSIRNYEDDGQKVNWVIFEPIRIQEQAGSYELWRVIDKEYDYYFKKQGETFTKIDSIEVGAVTYGTFENPFGEVPAIINSDIQKLGSKVRLSPIDNVVEAQQEYLRDRSILTIYKFKNGFSTHYRPAVICPECKGVGKLGIDKCTSCNGSGKILEKDVTDEIIIPIDLTSENPIQLPNDFAGFISPDLAIWDQYKKEAKDMEIDMSDAIWGTHKEESGNETATGRFLDTQPLENRLNSWSSVAEFIEWQFTEWIANLFLELKPNDERVSIVQYGRNYIIQPPQFLLEEYRKNKEGQVNAVISDRQLKEYITSKYKNDPETLAKELLKMRLEPYVHYPTELVKDIFGAKEAQKKMLFSDWWFTVINNNKSKSMGFEALEQDRDRWFDERINKLNINLKTEENE